MDPFAISAPTPSHFDSSVLRPLWDPSNPQTNRYADLLPVGTAQAGVLSRGQLKELGWTAHRIEHEIAVGRWTSVAPSVVVMQNGPVDEVQRQWIGVLHAGEVSALSHLSACRSAGLRWTQSEDTHVITPKGDLVPPLPGFVFHQSRRQYSGWVHPTAVPRRLDIEHAALLSAERDSSLRRAIGLLAAAVQQRLTTADRLVDASRGIRKLRHGRDLRRALGDIAGGAQSFAELDVGRLCASAGLVAPRRQAIRLDASGRRRYLDCEWELPDGRILVLEVDGSFHARVDHWFADIKRERGIVVGGRVVLRCSSVELRLEPTALLRDLRRMGVPPDPHSSAIAMRSQPLASQTNR